MLRILFAIGLGLSFSAVGEAASLSRRCDPVWEIPRPIYKRVKGRWVRTGWYCEVRQPNGGPSTGGGHGH